ncbi:hypothetical protein DFP73DRAFT_596165 [Morchella snyderi]|nr:hypothetical protein DFP73DRAFT_596165 [Morchella snyderi]
MAHSGKQPGLGDGHGKLSTIIDRSVDDTDSKQNSEMESNFDADSDKDGTVPNANDNSDIEPSTTVYPPNNAAEWWPAAFVMKHKLMATSIAVYFNQGLHKTLKCERSFQSAYTFQKHLDKMPGAPPNFQYGIVGDRFGKTTELY